jgi:hypothetical protein
MNDLLVTPIPVSVEFGIVIRRACVDERGITLDQVYRCMETSSPAGISNDLISFGPLFGIEAQQTFIRRLESLGLTYYEDFFDLHVDKPGWCNFLVSYAV